jgi:hypothetical protein
MPSAQDIMAPDLLIELPTIAGAEGRSRLIELASETGALHEATCELADALDAMHELHALPGGSYRRVYASSTEQDGWVLKMPNLPVSEIDDENPLLGAWSNVYEVEQAPAAYRGDIAPAVLVWHESGLPLVVMRRVIVREAVHELIRRTNPIPSWAEAADCGQVGWDDELGQWLIYDAGCSPYMTDAPQPVWWPGS